MFNWNRRWILLGLSILLVLTWSYIILNKVVITQPFSQVLEGNPEIIKVLFCDVHQGDAILVISPDGETTLIDGGSGENPYQHFNAGNKVLLPLFKRWHIQKLNRIVVSHPDQDHLGGLLTVLEHIPVNEVLDAIPNCTSPLYVQFKKLVAEKGIACRTLKAGDLLTLGKRVYAQVLWPIDITSEKSNNSSIVLRLTFGQIDFLLTGDIEKEVEGILSSQYGKQLDSEVLKVAHHGSKTSSTDIFLTDVAPECSVISVGKKNPYGHPNADVVKRIGYFCRNIWNTSQSGHIMVLSNGKSWKVVEQKMGMGQ